VIILVKFITGKYYTKVIITWFKSKANTIAMANVKTKTNAMANVKTKTNAKTKVKVKNLIPYNFNK